MVALAAAAGFCPDIVFCDIGMDGISGIDVAKSLRGDQRFDGTGPYSGDRLGRRKGFTPNLQSGIRFPSDEACQPRFDRKNHFRPSTCVSNDRATGVSTYRAPIALPQCGPLAGNYKYTLEPLWVHPLKQCVRIVAPDVAPLPSRLHPPHPLSRLCHRHEPMTSSTPLIDTK